MLVADFHVHIYPDYDLGTVLPAACSNLRNTISTSCDAFQLGLFLTERSDCSFFRNARLGQVTLPTGWYVESGREPEVLQLLGPNSERIMLFCGRQVVTSERLELLAWFVEDGLEDGCPFVDIQQQVLDLGGVPALPWAVGKWMFSRANCVAEILSRSRPETLVLVDSALRPCGWPEPRPMKLARQLGFTVVAGTDPLPSEEVSLVVGTYASGFFSGFDANRPVTSCREILLGRSHVFSHFGRRGNPYVVWKRLYRRSVQ